MIILVIENSTFFLCFIKSSYSKGDQQSKNGDEHRGLLKDMYVYVCLCNTTYFHWNWNRKLRKDSRRHSLCKQDCNIYCYIQKYPYKTREHGKCSCLKTSNFAKNLQIRFCKNINSLLKVLKFIGRQYTIELQISIQKQATKDKTEYQYRRHRLPDKLTYS